MKIFLFCSVELKTENVWLMFFPKKKKKTTNILGKLDKLKEVKVLQTPSTEILIFRHLFHSWNN